MVRILLFVTVLALGGAFFVAFSNVQGKIDNLESSLAQTETDLQRTRGELTKAKTAQKEAEEKMADAQSKAETAVANLRNTQQALVAQRQRADQHEATSKDLQAQVYLPLKQ